MMKLIYFFLLIASICINILANAAPLENTKPLISSEIDSLMLAELEKEGIEPAEICSDEVFLRRAYVDITGQIPTWQQSTEFLKSTDANKRSKLIDKLLDSQEFVDYTAMYWCNILRVKSEFPINLWPNAVQAYHHWLTNAVENNMPYDEFARELLTSSGSNFRVPQVNFYRAIQGKEPENIASAVCLTFMGIRYDKQTQQFRENIDKFFSRVAYKPTGEWKEEIVYFDQTIKDPIEAIFPDGKKITIETGQDPRVVFCNWLTSPDNKWFNRCIVNRIWANLNGLGIIEPADDICDKNKPSNPKLLSYLEQELVKNDYNIKAIYRLILNSNCWQRSSIAKSSNPKAETLFAQYNIRRLDAETLSDAICYLSGTEHDYSSMVPEPYTFIPGYHKTTQLADGSITSQFLEMFGRPSRDTGKLSERNDTPTNSQLLHLLNSTEIHSQVKNSEILSNIVKMTKSNKQMIERVYVLVLARYPTDEELTIVTNYIKQQKLWRKKAAEDIMWALINTKEFLYRH
ncbi:MAG: DUF1553 domain-containing protein [Sedimentisphaeraceae bacterium JB056]